MRALLLGSLLLCGLIGCAAVQQGKADYDLGKDTPLAQDELSPRDAAQRIVEPLTPFLPAPLQPLAGIAVTLLAGIGTWQRGRKLRKGQVLSSNPVTGHWGAKLGLESVIQHGASLLQGLYEVGPEGSGIRRGWKTLVSTSLALLSAALILPQARAFIMGHPDIVGLVTLLSSGFAGVEKELSKVLPVVKPPEG